MRHGWSMPWPGDGFEGDAIAQRAQTLRLDSLPWAGDEWSAPQTWRLIGLPEGDAAGIEWGWDWQIDPIASEPDSADPWGTSWWAGHETAQVGSMLHVRLLSGMVVWGDTWRATLTATARCGDQAIGELILEIGVPVIE